MAGALKTLYGALKASSFMSGVSLTFGEEYINAQEQALPYVCMVPTGGTYKASPGYISGIDPNIDMLWGISHGVDFYLWARAGNSATQEVDDADAVESLRQLVLSAFQDQQAQYTDATNVSYGLCWTPISERWLTDQNAVNRYGRCMVITFQPEISVPMAAPQEATVTSVLTTTTI